MAKRKYSKSVWQSLALVSQFGLTMLVPIGLMFGAGYWLDRTFGTSFWAVLLFFAGALAGFGNVFRLARRVYQDREDSGKEQK